MSLSTLLLPSEKGKEKVIDTGLDELFRSTKTAAPAPSKAATPGKDNEKKRTLSEPETASPKAKRPKAEKRRDKEKVEEAAPSSSKKKSAKKDAKQAEASPVHSSVAKKAQQAEDEEGHSSASSDDEAQSTNIVHESVSKGGKRKGTGRNAQTKYTPPDETPEQRNARTIFIGNVAMEVVKSRPLTKQLKRHILTAVPSAKIESIRFRSVAFSKPTAALPTDDDKSKSKGTPSKDGKKHGRERAAKWREENDDDEGEVAANAGRTFLSPSEKKKVAFIKHEFHSEVDSTNAYIVFAHPVPESAPRPANLPPPKPVMDPYEAARVAAEQMDGSTFLGRTIRVDVVGKGDKDQSQMSGDPKKTVFVGNLDFASKEEDLRAFFEGLMVTERGPPPAGGEDGKSDNESDEEEDEDEGKGKSKAKVVKPPTWVKRVRLIRDKDTLLGKGFGYVQFVDRECVDEILSLEPERLKFAKRKLRVQRCKTLPGGPKVSASQPPIKRAAAATSAAPARAARPPKAIAIPSNAPLPKGNPLLGEKISHLSKDERKKVKSTDADRVARRLAKKKAKAQMALQEKGIKAKDKERVRKRPKDKMKSKQSGGDKKKRVRSQKAIAKLNTKK